MAVDATLFGLATDDEKAVGSVAAATGPPVGVGLGGWMASHYLAPVATVIRAMLPPGMLERLEVIAEVTPAGEEALGSGSRPAVELDLLDELAGPARPLPDLATPEGRVGLLRRLRELAGAGLVELTPTLLTAAPGPRYERLVRLLPDGIGAHSTLAAGDRIDGRPLGPRQAAVLGELAADPLAAVAGPGVPAAGLGERHGSSALAGLNRRGLIESWIRERPRRPLTGRRPGLRGGRPTGAALTETQADAVRLVGDAIDARDPTPLLLDGVTGGGKTAIYVEAIASSLEQGRPALVLVPEIALATPLIDRLRADLAVRVALVHSGLSAGERADEWRRIRS